MTRIVAGRHGGRRIEVPTGRDTRPTADRVREALFSSLAALVELDGSHFADLYAGSGAVGLEAWSRGAAAVLLVESDARAARTARANIDALGAAPAVRLVTNRVERLLSGESAAPYDIVFADPPYALPAAGVSEMLAALVNGWLGEEGVVAVERSSRSSPLAWVPGLTGLHSRRYGETTLWYGRRS